MPELNLFIKKSMPIPGLNILIYMDMFYEKFYELLEAWMFWWIGLDFASFFKQNNMRVSK